MLNSERFEEILHLTNDITSEATKKIRLNTDSEDVNNLEYQRAVSERIRMQVLQVLKTAYHLNIK